AAGVDGAIAGRRLGPLAAVDLAAGVVVDVEGPVRALVRDREGAGGDSLGPQRRLRPARGELVRDDALDVALELDRVNEIDPAAAVGDDAPAVGALAENVDRAPGGRAGRPAGLDRPPGLVGEHDR